MIVNEILPRVSIRLRLTGVRSHSEMCEILAIISYK